MHSFNLYPCSQLPGSMLDGACSAFCILACHGFWSLACHGLPNATGHSAGAAVYTGLTGSACNSSAGSDEKHMTIEYATHGFLQQRHTFLHGALTPCAPFSEPARLNHFGVLNNVVDCTTCSNFMEVTLHSH